MLYTVRAISDQAVLGTFECGPKYTEGGHLTAEFTRALTAFCRAEGIPASQGLTTEVVKPTEPVAELQAFNAMSGPSVIAVVDAEDIGQAREQIAARLNRAGTYAAYLQWVMQGQKVEVRR